MDKQDIKSQTLPELTRVTAEMGLPRFRAGQIYRWLHQRQVGSFEAMSDLPVALRQELDKNFYINAVEVKKRLVSSIDGTVKYLYGLSDGNCVETVLMRYHHGVSLCISTQVGCRMGCRFCASTLGGLVRNLTPAEMLDEVYTAGMDSGERIGSVVLMGIGEPLDNYENVLRFLRILSSKEGMNLSLRHLSLSTCGLVEQIDALARENLQLTLSVSLHAPNDEIRQRTMPIAHRYPMQQLLAACGRYFEQTGRRISFEYALIEGINDAPEAARELAQRLQGLQAHVNLIPVNPVEGTEMRRGDRSWVSRFQQRLEQLGVNATVRRELGSDISAACGQLRRKETLAAGRGEKEEIGF